MQLIFTGDFRQTFGLWLRFLVFAAHFHRGFSPDFRLVVAILKFLPSAITDIDSCVRKNDKPRIEHESKRARGRRSGNDVRSAPATAGRWLRCPAIHSRLRLDVGWAVALRWGLLQQGQHFFADGFGGEKHCDVDQHSNRNQ